MPRRALNREELLARLARLLKVRGPLSMSDLVPTLGVAHATLSRLVEVNRDQIVRSGKARATRYAARRAVNGLPAAVPVYEILPSGKGRLIGALQAIEPRGYWYESRLGNGESAHFPDLPYFVSDARPQGYLGRLVPAQHPELSLPSDVLRWDGDTTLRYLTRYGWNAPGNLIVGDDAYARFLDDAKTPQGVVAGRRDAAYETFAGDSLRHASVGSSAGGEQPKFLVRRADDLTSLLVKFSPPVKATIGRRVADLLIAEHLALETLAEAGHPAAKSRIVVGRVRVFLEVERFDRVGSHGRRGVFSLATLDDQFVGRASGTWPEITGALVAAKRVPPTVLESVTRQWLFGRLTANADMHRHNLSFFHSGLRVEGLAPAYDMQPAHFAPRQNHIVDTPFDPPSPRPAEGRSWAWAADQSGVYWDTAAKDQRVSPGFRQAAAKAARAVAKVRELVELLPE